MRIMELFRFSLGILFSRSWVCSPYTFAKGGIRGIRETCSKDRCELVIFIYS